MLETRTDTQTLTVPTSATGATIVGEYLSRVRTALADVPVTERERLMEHAQAEIELELELRGLPVEDAATILAWKGSPAAYAERLRAHTGADAGTADGNDAYPRLPLLP